MLQVCVGKVWAGHYGKSVFGSLKVNQLQLVFAGHYCIYNISVHYFVVNSFGLLEIKKSKTIQEIFVQTLNLNHVDVC